uniref:Uncharacterized protein n=1 Tax=Tanacetum cinerariifolium TaxID=118510 RepID=A0A6L2JIJ0_TANCI|nr:hypothetical protein [Tanacetum cinerariifolium]
MEKGGSTGRGLYHERSKGERTLVNLLKEGALRVLSVLETIKGVVTHITRGNFTQSSITINADMCSASSVVIYTSVYTDSESRRVFWGVDEELSDGDYIPGPEEPQIPPAPQEEDEHEPMFIQPYDPDFVPEPIYPVYIPLEDEHILSAEEQPLPPVVSPTAKSPGYIVESDLEEDPEAYEDDDIEDGLVDYPMDGGDDDDDGDSFGDDVDDEDEDEEEEEEHLAPADTAIVIPIDELVASPEGRESVISPPSARERLARCMALAALPSPPQPSPLHMPPPAPGIGEVRYGIRGTWIDPAETVPEIAHMTVGEVYAHKFQLQTQLQLQSTLIQTQQQLHETHFQMQQTKIAELQETDRRHQAQLAETLRVMGDIRREMGDMQAELLALREQQRRAGQPGGDARVPNHHDASRDVDNHI